MPVECYVVVSVMRICKIICPIYRMRTALCVTLHALETVIVIGNTWPVSRKI